MAAWAAVAREDARDVVVERNVRAKLERAMAQGEAERMEEMDRQRSENDRILLEGMEKRNLAKQEEENTKAKVFSKPGTSKAPDEEAKDLIFF